MATAVTKAGPYFASGSISFSALRNTFRLNSPSGTISASELRRNTDVTNTDPIVPDSTENNSIATATDWEISQMRNSIKYYYVTQTSTNSNLDLDALNWNSNLSKNIIKELRVNGTIKSENSSLKAAVLNAFAHNLTIDLGSSGKIQGAGGSGGTSGSISGGNGGDALQIINVGNNVKVDLQTGSEIYGGGGGGEYGATGSDGADGNSGTCWNYQTSSVGSGCGYCGDCTNLGSEWENYGGCGNQQSCNCRGWGWWYGCSSRVLSDAQCRKKVYTTIAGGAGGSGGAGGNGGNGRGYNQSQSNGAGGSAGANGTAWAGCGGYGGTGSSGTAGSQGNTGGNGGNGGNWGESGGNTSNSGSGGSAGAAITGSGYTVTGTINSSTLKGSY